MGIPKFFRYVSERWPLISQLVNESKVPEFDNLYLDMNSILHNCTHKDSDVTHHLTEEQMFVAIFNYIDHLFTLIKPKKLFYMAIDGVAPRAKMNQQRSRRFRTALDAEEARRKAIEGGIELPSSDPFDSNAITPGTEFMTKLTAHLKYFINKKVSEDASWQGIAIVLSGHEVPGEGEHKIMDQIRSAKSAEDYPANERHCIYGLDADLIMLGLLSHEPHFALLREEVTFGRSAKANVELTDQRFFLLHLSLVREYLEIEFNDVRDETNIPYDFERILDDFILLNFFIGNDFLPELPSLVINDGALPYILKAYKHYLRVCDGYINEAGIINFERLYVWIEEMCKFEFKKFEESSIDVEWFNEDLQTVSVIGEESKNSKLSLTSKEKELVRLLKPFIVLVNGGRKEELTEATAPEFKLPGGISDDDVKFVRRLAEKTYTRVVKKENEKHVLTVDIDGLPDLEDDEELSHRVQSVQRTLKRYENADVRKEEVVKHKQEVYSAKFDQWRSNYYKSKFGVTLKDEEVIADVAENYLEGLQWVLLYYYRGCASWGWFYRFHYAPKINDLRRGLKTKFEFTLGQPFKPFEQLMGVLPARSKALVPSVYWPLMTEDTSPIIEFYPHSFELDMNGKKNDWEAVVKIPFVDEKRLLAAMETRNHLLSPEEKARNQFGGNLQFVFNPQRDTVYPSSMPGVFLDVTHSHCLEVVVEYPSLNGRAVKVGLVNGAKLGKGALAGFPSLKTLDIATVIRQANVKVFQMPSRNDSVVITIKDAFASQSPTSIAEKLLNESVYVGWPYLQEAKLVAISDDLFRYELVDGQVNNNPHPQTVLNSWRKKANQIREQYAQFGTLTGSIHVVAHVKKLKGLRRTHEGAYVKEFANEEDEYLMQTVVESVAEEDERYIERPTLPVSVEFPVDSHAVYLGPMGYGNPVTIQGHGADNVDILLKRLERGEPGVGSRAVAYEQQNTRYFPSFEVARMVSMHPLFLSKITARYLVELDGKRVNLGLLLKQESQQLKVIGYTRKTTRGWEFSGAAVQLITSFKQAFPQMFASLQSLSQSSAIPDMHSVLRGMPKDKVKSYVDDVRRWLKEKTTGNDLYEIASLETDALSQASIKKIEGYIIQYFSQPEPIKEYVIKGTPRGALLAPSHAYHQLRTQKFSLGDRVVSALNFGKVSLYSRGTVVRVNSSPLKVTLDVLFDREFDSGSTLGSLLQGRRCLNVDAGSVVNLTNHQLVYETKKSREASQSKAKDGRQKGTPAKGPAASAWGNKATQSSASPASKKPTDGTKPARQNPASTGKTPTKPASSKQAPAKRTPKASAHDSENASAVTPAKEAPPKQDEQLSKDLLAMLKGGNGAATTGAAKEEAAEAPQEPVKSNEEVLKSIKGSKNQKQSQRNLMSTLYGQYGGAPAPPQWSGVPPHFPQVPPGALGFPPPPPGGPMPPFPPHMMVPPFHPGPHPPFPPGAFPPPTQFDEAASADLMSQLSVSNGTPNGANGTNGTSGTPTRGRGRGGRGGARGRGNRSRGAPQA